MPKAELQEIERIEATHPTPRREVFDLIATFNGDRSAAARALGVSVSAINSWARGHRVPDSTIKHICLYLNAANGAKPDTSLIVVVPTKHVEALCRIIHSFDGKYIKSPQL